MATTSEASPHPEPLGRAGIDDQPSRMRPVDSSASIEDKGLLLLVEDSAPSLPRPVVPPAPAPPPVVVQDPIRLLRRYLSQVTSSSQNRASNKAEEGTDEENDVAGLQGDGTPVPPAPCHHVGRRRCRQPLSHRQVDDVLRVADFLFGTHSYSSSSAPKGGGGTHHHNHQQHASTSLGGLLDGALALLDASSSSGDDGDAAGRVNAALDSQHAPQSSSMSNSSLLTRVVSVSSGRSMYFVKGSTASSNKRKRSNHHHHQALEEAHLGPHYLCLFPEDDDDDDDNESSSVYYCSCRSFHDRSLKHGTALPVSLSSASTGTSGAALAGTTAASTTVLCKHLLALVLRPHLDVPLRVVECDTDEQFANYVLERMGI